MKRNSILYRSNLLFLFSPDFINIGIWEKFDVIQNETLKCKAASLPHLFKATFAEGTLSKYRTAWHNWVTWASQFSEVDHCPADPFFICIYLNDLVLEKRPISTVIASLCGIRWGHVNAGFVSPTDNPIVKLAFEGAKKLIGKNGSNKKEPFTVEMIKKKKKKKKLVEIFGDSQNLIELRFLVLCILGFSGFFRISELLDIQVRNITQRSNYIEILVSKSKTVHLREGHIVYISQTDTST